MEEGEVRAVAVERVKLPFIWLMTEGIKRLERCM